MIILKSFGIHIGQGSNIFPKQTIHGTRIIIGKNVFINSKCFFDTNGTITIKDNVSVGNQCTFVTTNHHIGPENKRAGSIVYSNSDIIIEEGCWIGARCVILPGVTIGKGCVIAAGSVVIKNCLANSLYAGVPAVFKRSLS